MPRKIVKKSPGVFEKVPGSGVWWIRFKVKGVERRERVGSRGDAVDLYRDRKTAIIRGEKLPHTLKKPGVKISELADDALAWYKKTGKKSIKSFSSQVNTIKLSPLGEQVADDVDHIMLELWIDDHSTWSPATCNRFKSCFSKMFSLGLKAKKTISNPAKLVDRRDEDNERARYLTAAEEARLRVQVAQQCPSQLPALTFALNTGARKSEQFRLTWNDIDLDRKQVVLRKTKNNDTRYVQLNKTTIKALQAIKRSEKHNFVFPSSRYDAALQNPRKWFETSLRDASITDFHWHDLRHTFISRMVMAGVSLAVVGKIAGHRDPRMTNRYAHLAPETHQEAVNKLDKAEIEAVTDLDKISAESDRRDQSEQSEPLHHEE
jgi:site-specific recombinase XerD